jgi:hypothetical protein
VHDRKTGAGARAITSPRGRTHLHKYSSGYLGYGGNGRQQDQDQDHDPMQGSHIFLSYSGGREEVFPRANSSFMIPWLCGGKLCYFCDTWVADPQKGRPLTEEAPESNKPATDQKINFRKTISAAR